ELFEVDHIRTIYHMFIALLILFILSTLAVDYIDEGRLVLEFNLMSYAFGKLTVAMWTWFTMFICTLTVPYFLFQRWARGYHRTSHPVVYSFIHCFLFVVFQTGVLGTVPVPTVNQYLYFLFAPTLIYRDNYPRTPTVRWGYVTMQFAQDWWNSTSYSNYYRTWNVVVHDWLYYYAYKDFLWVSSEV
ncbi:SOAT1, partial [Cervus elaphus hippelaphus]